MRLRLTEEHPIFKKTQQIFNLMDELGINIISRGYDTYVTDTDNNIEYKLSDNELFSYPMNSIPPSLEYKLTYEKED